MVELRYQGVTLQALANKYGVTRQRVDQIFQSYISREARAYAKLANVVYPNLRKFMVDNQLSYTDFAKLCDVTIPTIKNVLSGGHGMHGQTIEKILRVTGMSYDEAFKK